MVSRNAVQWKMPGAISCMLGQGSARARARCVRLWGMAGSQLKSRRVPVRALVVLFALVAIGVGLTLALTSGGGRKLVPGAGNRSGTFDPLGYTDARAAQLQRAAAAGEAHVVYAKSPGGVLATARRVAHFRPIIDRLAHP